MLWPTKNRKMNASANTVRRALSVRREKFAPEIHRILGEANEQGGGVASLASGICVARFVREVNDELHNRARIASEALSDALKSQKLNLRPARWPPQSKIGYCQESSLYLSNRAILPLVGADGGLNRPSAQFCPHSYIASSTFAHAPCKASPLRCQVGADSVLKSVSTLYPPTNG